MRNRQKTILIKNTTAYIGPELERHDGIDLLIAEGRIANISKKIKAQPGRVIDGRNYFVTPGFVNAHFHPTQQLNRALGVGMSHDMQMDLLHATDKIKTEKDKETTSYIAVLEGLKAGTTCFQSVGSEIVSQIPVYCKMGVRAVCVMIPKDIVAEEKKAAVRARAGETRALLDTAEEVHSKYHNKDGLVRVHFGVVNTRYASDALVKGMLKLADKYRVYYHAHEAEGDAYASKVKNRTGKTPVEHLYKIGALNRRVSLAHMTKLTDNEIRLLARTGTHVVCCPRSNAYGRVGTCPVDKLLAEGINVCLGSDAAINNNSNEVRGEAHALYDQLAARYENSDNPPIDFLTLFKMLTINGAKALGIEHETGTIEKGKKADLVLWSKNELPFVPGHNHLADLIFNDSCQAHTVIIDGKVVLTNHCLNTMNETALIRAGRKIIGKYYKAYKDEIAHHLDHKPEMPTA